MMFDRKQHGVTTMKLHKRQKQAIKAFTKIDPADDDIFLPEGYYGEYRLSGGAGTGKTTTTVALIKKLIKLAIPFVVLAPTHKAKAVIQAMCATEDILCDVRTIHSYLRLKPVFDPKQGKKVLKQGNKPQDDLFDQEPTPEFMLIDEYSMIDDELKKFIDEEREEIKCRVIFIGDAAQIPPVNQTDSAVVEIQGCKHHKLSRIFRQKKNNSIIDIATSIRLVVEGFNDSIPDLTIREVDKSKHGYAHLDQATFWGTIRSALEKNKDVVYLGYTNAATDKAGKLMRQMIKGNAEMFEPGELYNSNAQVVPAELNGSVDTLKEMHVEPLKLGNNEPVKIEDRIDMIMPSRANYFKPDVQARLDEHLPIGEIEGYWLTFTDGREGWQPKNINHIKNIKDRLWKSDAKRMLYPELGRLDSYLDLRLPYSMTVHKSQGSTFEIAAIDLDDLNKALRDRTLYTRLLYTAITRASKLVITTGESNY